MARVYEHTKYDYRIHLSEEEIDLLVEASKNRPLGKIVEVKLPSGPPDKKITVVI